MIILQQYFQQRYFRVLILMAAFWSVSLQSYLAGKSVYDEVSINRKGDT